VGIRTYTFPESRPSLAISDSDTKRSKSGDRRRTSGKRTLGEKPVGRFWTGVNDSFTRSLIVDAAWREAKENLCRHRQDSKRVFGREGGQKSCLSAWDRNDHLGRARKI